MVPVELKPFHDEDTFSGCLGAGIAQLIVIPICLVIGFFVMLFTILPKAIGAFFHEFNKDSREL